VLRKSSRMPFALVRQTRRCTTCAESLCCHADDRNGAAVEFEAGLKLDQIMARCAHCSTRFSRDPSATLRLRRPNRYRTIGHRRRLDDAGRRCRGPDFAHEFAGRVRGFGEILEPRGGQIWICRVRYEE